MILQELAKYYDRVTADPASADALPKPGYSVQQISFCVVLLPDGTLQGFQAIDDGEKKPRALKMLVPGQSHPSGSGATPRFLWDKAEYLLGYKVDDEDPERTKKLFSAYRDYHVDLETKVNEPAFSTVCSFLRNWSSTIANERVLEFEKFITNSGVFKIAGVRGYIHEIPAIAKFWNSLQSNASDENVRTGMCLVTGEIERLARKHEPLIKPVRGGQSSGGLLVSFNDAAYESFEKDKGENAPVGEATVFKYANALNYLLSRRDHRSSLGDATVTYWAERPTMLERVIDPLFGEEYAPKDDAPAEDKQRAAEVAAFVRQLREGHADADAIDPDDQVGFYILGLSPNASRISVRFWIRSNVAEMKARLRQHLDDIELVGARDGDPPLVIKRIVEATGRAKMPGYDGDTVPATLEGAMANAVFQGTMYPQMLLATMLNRLRADGYVSHVRVAAIKGVIVRNNRLKQTPKEVPVALDLSRTDSPYVTGRLFALLERIQSDAAGGDLNATIKDRYFSAASATPGTVFPRLIRLSQHHLSNLAKEKPGLKVNHDRLCGEIVGKLDGFATHFNLEDQGLFAVGYYHQRQDFFTSKKPKDTTEEGETK